MTIIANYNLSNIHLSDKIWTAYNYFLFHCIVIIYEVRY